MPEERDNIDAATASEAKIRNPPGFVKTESPPQSAIRNDVVWTIEQVAEYLQLHPQVVYRHVRAGTLPASRIGRTIRFKKSVLDAFLERDAWQAAGRFLAFVETEKSKVSAAHARAIPTAENPEEKPAEVKPAVVEAELEAEARPVRKFSVDVD